MQKPCIVCGTIIEKKPTTSLKEWYGRTRYCSRKCFGIDRRGKRYGTATEFKKGKVPYNKGKFDIATKYGIHNWVKQTLGQPKVCEQCGSDFWVEWANKSQQYKAIESDWLRLCRKCHMKYDKEFGIREHSNWKGGKPKCIDCGLQLSSYLAKRCRKCNGKIQSVFRKGIHFSPSTEFKKK